MRVCPMRIALESSTSGLMPGLTVLYGGADRPACASLRRGSPKPKGEGGRSARHFNRSSRAVAHCSATSR